MRNAFSLVELSIVLVILGLLTGGILAGQSLIRAAELRSIPTDLQKYQAAVMSFRDKYVALPGDMRNATSFWGAMTNCGVASPSGTGTQTCNGDGDGNVESALAASQTGEIYAFWQQLANAGLIEGSYSGIASSTGANAANAGTNVPKARISNSVYVARFHTSDWWANGASPGNSLIFGSMSAADGDGGVITASEMWNLDTKMDDEKPTTGKIISSTNTTKPNCASTDSAATAVYQLTNTAQGCSVYFARPGY